MTLQELLDRLRQEDEVTLLELLSLQSDDIVDAFYDKIVESIDRIAAYYE